MLALSWHLLDTVFLHTFCATWELIFDTQGHPKVPIATQVARQLPKDVPREGRGRGGRGFGSHFGVPQETQNPTKYGKVPPGRSLCLGPGNLEKEHRLVDPPERPK